MRKSTINKFICVLAVIMLLSVSMFMVFMRPVHADESITTDDVANLFTVTDGKGDPINSEVFAGKAELRTSAKYVYAYDKEDGSVIAEKMWASDQGPKSLEGIYIKSSTLNQKNEETLITFNNDVNLKTAEEGFKTLISFAIPNEGNNVFSPYNKSLDSFMGSRALDAIELLVEDVNDANNWFILVLSPHHGQHSAAYWHVRTSLNPSTYEKNNYQFVNGASLQVSYNNRPFNIQYDYVARKLHITDMNISTSINSVLMPQIDTAKITLRLLKNVTAQDDFTDMKGGKISGGLTMLNQICTADSEGPTNGLNASAANMYGTKTAPSIIINNVGGQTLVPEGYTSELIKTIDGAYATNGNGAFAIPAEAELIEGTNFTYGSRGYTFNAYNNFPILYKYTGGSVTPTVIYSCEDAMTYVNEPLELPRLLKKAVLADTVDVTDSHFVKLYDDEDVEVAGAIAAGKITVAEVGAYTLKFFSDEACQTLVASSKVTVSGALDYNNAVSNDANAKLIVSNGATLTEKSVLVKAADDIVVSGYQTNLVTDSIVKYNGKIDVNAMTADKAFAEMTSVPAVAGVPEITSFDLVLSDTDSRLVISVVGRGSTGDKLRISANAFSANILADPEDATLIAGQESGGEYTQFENRGFGSSTNIKFYYDATNKTVSAQVSGGAKTVIATFTRWAGFGVESTQDVEINNVKADGGALVLTSIGADSFAKPYNTQVLYKGVVNYEYTIPSVTNGFNPVTGELLNAQGITSKYAVLDPNGDDVTVTSGKFTPTVDGLYTVQYYARFGEVTYFDSIQVEVLAEGPAIEITTQDFSASYDKAQILDISASATTDLILDSDAVKVGMTVSVNGSAPIVLTGKTQRMGFSTGSYTLVYTATDCVGRTETATVQFEVVSNAIDLSVAKAIYEGVVGYPYAIPEVNVNLAGVFGERLTNEKVVYTNKLLKPEATEATDVTGSFTPDVAGIYNIEYHIVVDGKTFIASLPVKVYAEDAAPAIHIVTPTFAESYEDAQILEVTASSYTSIILDDSVKTVNTLTVDGTHVINITGKTQKVALSKGAHVLVYKAVDPIGREATKTINLTINSENIDLGLVKKVTDSIRNKTYEIPTIKFDDAKLFGERTTDVAPTYVAYSVNPSGVETLISNNTFKVNVAGEWKVKYVITVDGKTFIETMPVVVYQKAADAPEIIINAPEFKDTYTFTETLDIYATATTALSVDGSVKSLELKINNVAVPLYEGATYTFAPGTNRLRYTATDYTGRTQNLNITIVVDDSYIKLEGVQETSLVEVGESIVLSADDIVCLDENIAENKQFAEYNVAITVAKDGAAAEPYTQAITAAAGTYVVTYTASYKLNASDADYKDLSITRTITCKDICAPKFITNAVENLYAEGDAYVAYNGAELNFVGITAADGVFNGYENGEKVYDYSVDLTAGITVTLIEGTTVVPGKDNLPYDSVAGFKFTTEGSKKYVVKFSVSDGTNVTEMFYIINAKDVLYDVAFNGLTAGQQLEVNEEIDLNDYVVANNKLGSAEAGVTFKFEYVYGADTVIEIDDGKFTPGLIGNYKVIVKAIKGDVVEQASVNVVVKDTTAPVITINETNQTYSAGSTIFAYTATVADNYDSILSYKVYLVDGDEQVELKGNSFVAEKAGEYTLVYKAVDNAGNEAESKTVTIKVGAMAAGGGCNSSISMGLSINVIIVCAVISLIIIRRRKNEKN